MITSFGLLEKIKTAAKLIPNTPDTKTRQLLCKQPGLYPAMRMLSRLRRFIPFGFLFDRATEIRPGCHRLMWL